MIKSSTKEVHLSSHMMVFIGVEGVTRSHDGSHACVKNNNLQIFHIMSWEIQGFKLPPSNYWSFGVVAGDIGMLRRWSRFLRMGLMMQDNTMKDIKRILKINFPIAHEIGRHTVLMRLLCKDSLHASAYKK